MMLRTLTALCLAVLVPFTVAAVDAQDQKNPQARITGRVVDFAGAVLPGVDVTLTGAGDARTTSTGADGRFVFEAVKPFPAYTVSIQLAGFISDTQKDIGAAAGETRTVDFAMEIGCVGDLTVTGLSTLERLRGSAAVAHVRTTDTVVDRDDGCGPRRIAFVVAVLALSPAAPPEGATINLVGESGRFQADKNYLVVLDRPYGRKYPFWGGYWAREVVRGRIRGSDADLDIREGMSLEDASRQLHAVLEMANRDPR